MSRGSGNSHRWRRHLGEPGYMDVSHVACQSGTWSRLDESLYGFNRLQRSWCVSMVGRRRYCSWYFRNTVGATVSERANSDGAMRVSWRATICGGGPGARCRLVPGRGRPRSGILRPVACRVASADRLAVAGSRAAGVGRCSHSGTTLAVNPPVGGCANEWRVYTV